MMKVLIYSPQLSERLSYACTIVFKNILKIKFDIIQSFPDTTNPDAIKINYSHEPINNAFQVVPSGLLEQNGIFAQEIKTGKLNDTITLFPTEKGDLPFDLFSAVFYMTSRYEEYLPFEPDEHGRFRAEDSLAFKQGFHSIPVVDLWVKLFADKIEIPFPTDTYKFILTIDVDEPWKTRNHSLWRINLKLGKLLLTGQFKLFSETLAIFLNQKADLWFTFDYLDEVEKNLTDPIQYFVLLGRKRPFDVAPSLKNKAFKKLIIRLGSKQKLGIHPSYESFQSLEKLESEYYGMSYVLENKIQRSRQHFLRMKFPETFRNLIKLGIRQEYSMGWVSQVGFRAGIARPFPFYDLEAEKETHLILVPFFAMERSLKKYMKLDIASSEKELLHLIDIVKEVNGQFCMLWHNDSVSDDGEWKGWKTLFEKITQYAGRD
jgi:hypothetical protein